MVVHIDVSMTVEHNRLEIDYLHAAVIVCLSLSMKKEATNLGVHEVEAITVM